MRVRTMWDLEQWAKRTQKAHAERLNAGPPVSTRTEQEKNHWHRLLGEHAMLWKLADKLARIRRSQSR